MKKYGFHSFYFLLLLLLLQSSMAWAHLGGSEKSVDSDCFHFKGAQKTARASAGGLYHVREIESNAHKIREYLDSNGVVFGVAWNGFVHPDLNTLLGSYSTEYKTSLKSRSTALGKKHSCDQGKRSHSMKSSNIVVEKTGHMRNLRGRAYLVSGLPAGVSVDEIK